MLVSTFPRSHLWIISSMSPKKKYFRVGDLILHLIANVHNKYYNSYVPAKENLLFFHENCLPWLIKKSI